MDINNLITDNLRFYNSNKPKNPPNCYTVLATLNDYNTGQLLCLATGTQASLKQYDDDIQDCHAESLVKRAYKRYVIDRVKNLLSDPQYRGEKVNLRSQISDEVILFVSKFPCGFLNRYEGQEPVDSTTGNVIKRKPGRGTERDGQIVYVEKDSCFVKLKRWLENGIQGISLKQVIGIETRIKRIVIGDCETSDHFDYQTYLEEFAVSLGLNQTQVEIHHVDPALRRELIFESSAKAQSVSFVWWRGEHNVARHPNNSFEWIVDGHRRGLTKQHCSGDRIGASARLRIGDANYRCDLEHISSLYNKKQPLTTKKSSPD